MDIHDVEHFVEKNAQVLSGYAAKAKQFTSGGWKEDVWCESRSMACELYCYQFGKLDSGKPTIRWGEKPELIERVYMVKVQTPYLEPRKMYCVTSSLEMVADA